MLFKKWATLWAEKICRFTGENDAYKIALTRYVLESLLSAALSISCIILAAWLLGILKTAVVICFAAAFIKAFTGGLHSSTPLRCAISGAFYNTILAYLAICLPFYNLPLVFPIVILAFINMIVWKKAPHETKEKPLTERQKLSLAFLSRLLMFTISVICLIWPRAWGVNELFYAACFQVINLLEITSKGMQKIDDLLYFIERKPVF